MEKKKVKKIRELFVQDLARYQGGQSPPNPPPGCPNPTSFVCGEEPYICLGC